MAPEEAETPWFRLAKASGAKAEATGTATDELSEDGLEAVAGGKGNGRSNRYCGG